MSEAGSKVAEPKWTPIDSPLLTIPKYADLRIAGQSRVYKSDFTALPTGGPKLPGIAVVGGAIWLPKDGSEPYFSSGKS